jgi:multiple sugar transport system ATP-binding protein
MGAETFLHLETGQTSFIARVAPHLRPELGDTIRMSFDPDRTHLFDATTGQALR